MAEKKKNRARASGAKKTSKQSPRASTTKPRAGRAKPPEPTPGIDYAASRRRARKLPAEKRPMMNNPEVELANNLPELAEQIKACTRCRLSETRSQSVPGEGPPKAEIMFIGEAPGFYEDQQGRPFVGASGNFLNELLKQIGLERKDVFITNVVKSRPPQNRDPLPDEIEACRLWLDQQIKLIKPKVIVTISRYAMARWFPNEKVSKIHGSARRFGDLVVVPMYHPAAALHQQSLRRVIEEDFKKLPDYIKHPPKVPSGSAPDSKEPPGEQMKMF